MNELAIHSSGPPADRELERELETACSRLADGILLGGISAEARRAFAARRDVLRPWLAPAEQGSIEAAVSRLMTSFYSSRSVSQVEAKVTVRKYAIDLAGIPIWAIQKACDAIARGEVEGASLDFPPAAPRLRQVADDFLAPTVAEVYRLNRVLGAREERLPDPAAQKRIMEGLKALGKALTETSRFNREASIAESIAAFQAAHGDKLAAIPDLPPKGSDYWRGAREG